MFIGRRTAEGVIRGERFARTLVHDKAENTIKDHWEKKVKGANILKLKVVFKGSLKR